MIYDLTGLIDFCNQIVITVCERKTVDAVYLNIKKAFPQYHQRKTGIQPRKINNEMD